MSEKILEKLVTIKIKTWAEQNAIFNIQQNGFRKNRCINDNLFKSNLSIKQNSNKTMIYTAVFFGVEKASDQVWHKGLPTKLYNLGSDISVIKWIKSFPLDRGLIMNINDTLQ